MLSPPCTVDRLEAVDVLRGVVMALMALDHIRYFFHWGSVHFHSPLTLGTTTIPLFFTRWITHFCAPVFVFLAGTGAFLSITRGKSKRQLSWFLVTRGLWLVFLELTFIHWAGWAFALDFHHYAALVIWVIGWSMVVLALLVHLPGWVIVALGAVMVAGHNALDGIKPQSFGAAGWLWQVVHARGGIEFASGYQLSISYPLIPWVGVMALGYGFGQLLRLEPAQRRRRVFWTGAAVTLGFIALRWFNAYGDPLPWTPQARTGFTLLSFLRCEKYPPSLCYLMMTLGPALMALALLDRPAPRWLEPIRTFGRVPLFYYLLHLPVIHGLAVLAEQLRGGSAEWLIQFPSPLHRAPAGAGYSLVTVYLIWIAVLGLLYPACRWFADLKRRRRDAWLSYW